MDVDMDEDDTHIDNLLGLVELSEELGESGIDDESLSQETRANLLLWWKWEEDKASGVNYLPPKTRQAKNVYDRRSAWEFVLSWDEVMFSRQFRMKKGLFRRIVQSCKENYPGRSADGLLNYRLAQTRSKASSGGNPPITMEIKLAITLRLLAGASALDMVWYGVCLPTIEPLFHFSLLLLDKALSNEKVFRQPDTEEDWEEMAREWRAKMVEKKKHPFMNGTCLAGDGFVATIVAPRGADLDGMNLAAFRNRKGCFAVLVQAFCDAHCRFRFFRVGWPGATGDITAYKQMLLFAAFTDGKVPAWVHMVLDEAYASIGGDQHLCPYSKHQLEAARARSEEEYGKYKTFNHVLSSQRITIERAFGILVRKWGILWRPLSRRLKWSVKILKICAKLHNVVIDYRLEEGATFGEEEGATGAVRGAHTSHQREPDGDWCANDEWRQYEDEGDAVPTDTMVTAMLSNYYLPLHSQRAAVDSRKRQALREELFDHGHVYHSCQDNDFTHTSL